MRCNFTFNFDLYFGSDLTSPDKGEDEKALNYLIRSGSP